MKIRTDFVTNSSSSSFIVEVSSDIPDVFKLAEKMIDIRNKEWKSYSSRDDYTADENDLKFVRETTEDRNRALCFNTTNYPTYIVKVGNWFVVDTCNNHDWWESLDVGSSEMTWVREHYLELIKEIVSPLWENKGNVYDFDEGALEYVYLDGFYFLSKHIKYTPYTYMTHQYLELKNKPSKVYCCDVCGNRNDPYYIEEGEVKCFTCDGPPNQTKRKENENIKKAINHLNQLVGKIPDYDFLIEQMISNLKHIRNIHKG